MNSTAAQIDSCSEPETASRDRFLAWFANQKIPMFETPLRVGGLDYYHFTSFFLSEGGRQSAGFGSDVDRKIAALKCAGETIERQAMTEFFSNK